ncbi:hypothetical protein [Pelobacter propionicus]|uniref:Uncharacterized protein n=1 Tax=Pelobacter propionicus (strain DSM 2379 / NBRC 103807 / OttBd1) TaxID=338966 RepID=A1ALR1_PELPD|nr:hypothetical protein [Pelobacter propionicus]ABK98281.1 conserved hypothetical protein [Pelobacter propionicus DSM 2379]
MQKITLKSAAAGMVLARDIFRNGTTAGFPVCGKKTVLTASLITRLEHMDIATIYVEGCPCGEEGDRSLDAVLHDLEHRFVKVRHDPLMARLYDIYSDYYKRSMGDEGGRQTE